MVTKSSAFNDASQFYKESAFGKEKEEVRRANQIIEGKNPTPPKQEITTAAAISGGPQGVAGTYMYRKKKKKKDDEESLREQEGVPEDPVEFARERRSGAEAIAESAEEKGGSATLTFWHFDAKLPAYDEAIEAMEADESPEFFNGKYSALVNSLMAGGLDQKTYQSLLGEIEVWGEIAIFLGAKIGGEPVEPKEKPKEPEAEPEPTA